MSAATDRLVNEDATAVNALADALHAELKLGAEASSIPQPNLNKVLVLLDCNGFLVHRSKERHSVKRPDYNVPTGFHKQFDSFFYIRPHARELVCCLLHDPRCEVAVYTSIMGKNVMPIILGFDKHYQQMSRDGNFAPVSCGASTASSGYIDRYSLSLLDDSLGLFDREYNSPDPQGENDWDTVRDLHKIWKARKVKKMGFNKHNTLVIDAEARKVKRCTANALVIPEYTENDLLRTPTEETTLQGLWDYLDNTVLRMMQNDAIVEDGGVPEILRKHPYAANQYATARVV